MRRRQLSPKQCQLWIVATVGIGAAVNVLIRIVTSSGFGELVAPIVGIGCLFTAAGLVGHGPLRRAFLPENPQVEPTSQPSPDEEGPIDQLVRLAEGRESGNLSQGEFEAQKRRILNPPLAGTTD